MIKAQGWLVSVAYVREFVECKRVGFHGKPGETCDVCGQAIDGEVQPCHPGDIHVQGAFLSFEQYAVNAELDLSDLQGYEAASRDWGGLLKRTGDTLVIELVTTGFKEGESLYSFAPKHELEIDDAPADPE